MTVRVTCPMCGGAKFINDVACTAPEVCPGCQGNGWQELPDPTVNMNIPRWVPDRYAPNYVVVENNDQISARWNECYKRARELIAEATTKAMPTMQRSETTIGNRITLDTIVETANALFNAGYGR